MGIISITIPQKKPLATTASPAPGWRLKNALMVSAVAWEYWISWGWVFFYPLGFPLTSQYKMHTYEEKYCSCFGAIGFPPPGLLRECFLKPHLFRIEPKTLQNRQILSDAIRCPETSPTFWLRSPGYPSDAIRRLSDAPFLTGLRSWDLT